ncbi:MAG: hypothetical protein HY298_24530 [Verrucomicrobia bacterium]|nr:hypothetical protein [Verrucomicrobiota bacterium]
MGLFDKIFGPKSDGKPTPPPAGGDSALIPPPIHQSPPSAMPNERSCKSAEEPTYSGSSEADNQDEVEQGQPSQETVSEKDLVLDWRLNPFLPSAVLATLFRNPNTFAIPAYDLAMLN